MKQKLLKTIRLRVMMLVAVLCAGFTSAWGADVVAYTLTPASGSNNAYAGNCDIAISGITWNLTGNSTMQPWRIGGKSLNGVDRTLYSKTAISDNITKIEVTHGAASSVTVNSWTVIVSKNSDFSSPVSTLTPTFATSTTTTISRPDGKDWSNCYFKFVYNVTIGGSNKFIEFSEAKFYKETAASYTITAASNNTSYGTVSLEGNVITANPAEGYTYADPAYTVSSGTATVSQNGNEFTVSASSDCTVTINFEAKPTVSGYTVDFENELDAYTDWTFTNAALGSSNIDAHGGTYYATTGGKTSATFKTNDPIAYPNEFTCYVSKESNNTTASTWAVEVSSDGSAWTEVETQDATSMTKGSWTEFTANLSSYSDVYVRLVYSGSTAVRTVDDISITMRDPNAKITPTVSIDAAGLATDLAGSTDVSAGTVTATVASGETTITTPAVTWSSSNTSVATVNASTGAVTLIATGSTNLIATFAGNDDYNEASASYELTVMDSYAKGQVNNPYTVAEAIENAPASGTSDNVYIRGIVSAFHGTDIVSDGNNYRYYISDDGTTTNQLLVYKGKKNSTDNFSDAGDLEIGDVVVIYGGLTTYNSTKEVASGNYIVSRTTKTASDLTKTGDIALSATDLTATASATDYFTTSSTGAFSYEIADETVATVSAAGVVTPVAVGTTTLTVSQAADATYKAGSLEITVTVAAASLNSTTIVANASGSTAYGTNKVEDYMIDDTYDGYVAAVSSNPAVATVAITQHTAGEGTFTITPVAVGTAVITISAPATATCEAADDVTYTITVTAPAGGTTAAPASVDPVTIDFTNNAFSLPTSSSNATTGDITDGTYTLNVSGGNGAYYYSDGDALLMGKSGATLTLPIFNNEITKIEVTGSSKAGSNVKQNIFVGETAVSTETTGAKDVTNVYEINPNYQTAGTQYLLKVTSAHNTQISSIKIYFASTDLSVKLNTSGYATYCSLYPLDFSAATDYSAWQITGVSGETITFSQITGSVKGGTGILLKGTASETVTLTSADSDNELSGNKLFGTLAPTYVAVNEYYGLSGNSFVKVNAGTVKAGKALLPASEVDGSGSGAKAFTFVFEGADGIKTVEHVSAEQAAEIFNLAGQRLQKAQRGVNIINGKKVLVK